MSDKKLTVANLAKNLVSFFTKPTPTVSDNADGDQSNSPREIEVPTTEDVLKDNTEDVPVKIKEVPPPVVKPVVQKQYSPIPVKINNSDILMEGKVRSYIADNRTWQDVTLKLTADGELTKNNQPLELSPFRKIGPSRIVNVPGAFNLDTSNESDWRPGDLFATTAKEDAEKWINVLTYVRCQKLVANKHEHPLDEVNRKNKCRICNEKPKENSYADGHACMFCKEGEYEVCTDCQYKLNNLPKDLLIDTPHHPHKLMVCESARQIQIFAEFDKQVHCNHCGKPTIGRYYYCPRCEYVECVACAVPATSGSDQTLGDAPMQLHVNLLQDFVKSKAPNHFKLEVKKSQRTPNRLSMVSNKPWNLSTIDTCQPDAYFEVTFENFNAESLVSVGVGNQIFVQNKPLGDQRNSFGYFHNGQATCNSYYSNEEGFPRYTKGDTIGVGVLLDSYNEQKLYFTKNGQFLKCYEKKVHRGMDCFPGVSFNNDSEAEFVVNFTGPFKFDVNSIPNYRTDQSCRFGTAPLEVVAQILSYAAENPTQVCEWRTLSKKMNEAASHNAVWKDLYMGLFPHQNANLKIKSWFKFYKRRVIAASKTNSSPFGGSPMIIENCDFEFECPLIFEQLKQKDPTKYEERHCNKCNKTVYQVYGEHQLKEYMQMGRCVTLYQSSGLERNMPRMGSMPAPRAPIPHPF
jgi:hypothetical protein